MEKETLEFIRKYTGNPEMDEFVQDVLNSIASAKWFRQRQEKVAETLKQIRANNDELDQLVGELKGICHEKGLKV